MVFHKFSCTTANQNLKRIKLFCFWLFLSIKTERVTPTSAEQESTVREIWDGTCDGKCPHTLLLNNQNVDESNIGSEAVRLSSKKEFDLNQELQEESDLASEGRFLKICK